MNQPFLTIGMACHDDFYGVWSTINDLRLHHNTSDCELIVVDNSPDTQSGKDTAGAVANCKARWHSAKYIKAPEVVGTSAPRDRAFKEATGKYVLCIDCHILLMPGALERLKQYYRDNPETSDLLTGPMLMDNLVETATHFSPRWRDEMEGTWGLAWRCTKCNNMIDVIDEPDHTTTMYRALLGDGPYKAEYRCNCGNLAPACPWGRHEERLIEAGWQPHGMRNSDAPFEIPAQGLGLFTCRREAWLGFHPLSRGFGGEECYVHRKYRQAGHRCLNLPGVAWYHRFGHPHGRKYNVSRYSKCRNYFLEYQELGMDPLTLRPHFAALPDSEWAFLVADPVNNENGPSCTTCNKGGQNLPISEGELPTTDRKRFAELAGQHKRVAILAKRDWWRDVVTEGEQKPEVVQFHPADASTPTFTECDLLIIHSRHHAETLFAELKAWAPTTTSRILLRSTGTFGEQAEGGGPGLLPAMRRFMREHPEWSVMEHSQDNWGYTVLSRLPEDKPKLPGTFTMAVNLAKALTAHVADGLEKTSMEGMEARLNTCSLCPHRIDDRCGVCGCYLIKKAEMRSSECPIGDWPIDDPGGTAAEPKTDEEKAKLKIFFDIDGVLNNTPARGGLGFGADTDKIARLMALPGEKVCISLWRHEPQSIDLPFEYTCAPTGAKGQAWNGATIILDDDATLYPPEAPVYAVKGLIGLTDEDIEAIAERLGVKPDWLDDEEVQKLIPYWPPDRGEDE